MRRSERGGAQKGQLTAEQSSIIADQTEYRKMGHGRKWSGDEGRLLRSLISGPDKLHLITKEVSSRKHAVALKEA